MNIWNKIDSFLWKNRNNTTHKKNRLNESHILNFKSLLIIRTIIGFIILLQLFLSILIVPKLFMAIKYLTFWGAGLIYLFYTLVLIENYSFYFQTKKFNSIKPK